MITPQEYTKKVGLRIQNERLAVDVSACVHELFYNRGIEITIFRNQLRDKSASQVLELHQYATDFVGKTIRVDDTLEMLLALKRTAIEHAKLDIGRITHEWSQTEVTADHWIMDHLESFFERSIPEPRDVILFGFGRIGRLLARELIVQEGSGQQLRLRAVAVRSIDAASLHKRASLLKIDSVHGDFPGTIVVDEENFALIINGRPVYFIPAPDPSEADYTAYGINNALLIDNSGAFRDKNALSRHLQGKGVDKVLLTAPGKGIPNIVHGVNHNTVSKSERIISAASCTTNAISPVLKVINDHFGIERGHLETIHAYTNDQNLVDNMHSKYRRGRAAAMNMVITETGAGKAVDKCIPGLGEKLTSSAIRVPVPNGSLAILNLQLERPAELETIHNTVKNAALSGALVEQIHYNTSNELVSSDIVGNPCPSIYDVNATQVTKDGKSAVLYVWYDNEYGYSRQVLRLAKYHTGVRRPSYY
ncbi:MAG: glyceraldehyde-3-phosphate dehydrogenase [Schleiferiaceae bacterium]|nr:glyceraldehyde-3-phosphate dehydrogenase [Schleiferiaceae bacterium]